MLLAASFPCLPVTIYAAKESWVAGSALHQKLELSEQYFCSCMPAVSVGAACWTLLRNISCIRLLEGKQWDSPVIRTELSNRCP